jgi:hypothetical protein
MEQRRFFEVGGEESGEWLVLDGNRHPPRAICRCHGWNAPKNAALIVAALEAHNSELYSKFPLDGSGLNEPAAVIPNLPSGEPPIGNSWRWSLPSAFITQIAHAPARSEAKAIVLPSGDQAGNPSLEPSLVSRVMLPP